MGVKINRPDSSDKDSISHLISINVADDKLLKVMHSFIFCTHTHHILMHSSFIMLKPPRYIINP